MTEGPEILFLKNKLQRNKGKLVAEIFGNVDLSLPHKTNVILNDIETFGENLLFIFKDFFICLRLESAASLLVNKKKKIDPIFSLKFADSELNFYNTSVKLYTGKIADHFNFKLDLLRNEFDLDLVLNELSTTYAEEQIGEVLRDQQIFPGVGAIISSETLYHAKIHPESIIKAIPEKKLLFLLNVMVDYGEEYLTLLKKDEVKSQALIFEKQTCPKDRSKIIVRQIEDEIAKTYVCEKCQKLFK